MSKTNIALVVHLFFPVLLAAFLVIILKRIKLSGLPRPPSVHIVAIFFFYGGALAVILTSLFWEWSGAASLGFALLLTVGPVAMAWIAFWNHRRRALSLYYRNTAGFALGYFVIFPLAVWISSSAKYF